METEMAEEYLLPPKQGDKDTIIKVCINNAAIRSV